jgi:acetyl-CoA synthetase
MLRGIWGDPQRYVDTYWSRWPQYYFAGDGAKLDEDGAIWLLGRVDDVMNISGHRISTTEVESALVSHPQVAEAAVVGATDATTGQGIVAFVILRGGLPDDAAQGDALVAELRAHVAHEIGPIAKPRQIMVVPRCPRPAGQDHAATAARRRRAPRHRRRHHAGRPGDHGPHLGRPVDPGGRLRTALPPSATVP